MALTEKEARALIEELKRCAEKKIEFPSVGQKQEFYTYSMDNRHQYTIHIYRGKINRLKYNISADASKEVEPMIRSLFGERHAFPDVTETLRMLDEAGVEYAIGSTTDTDSLQYFLDLNRLTFEHVFTSEDMKVYKPDKRFYERILALSGWNLDECLFVGDNIVDDVKGPKSIGMKAVLLDRKGSFDEAGADVKPDYVIRSLTELEKLI